MAKGDNRAVVGSSGKPLPGMVLESGAKQVGKILGKYTTHPEGASYSGGNFDVDGMRDVSMNSVPEPGKV